MENGLCKNVVLYKAVFLATFAIHRANKPGDLPFTDTRAVRAFGSPTK